MTRSRLLILIAFVNAALCFGLGCSSSQTRAAPAETIASNPCGGKCTTGQRCCNNNCDGTKYCVTGTVCPNLTCPPDLQSTALTLASADCQSPAGLLASADGNSLVECDGTTCDAGKRCCVIDCGGTRACRSPCIPPLCPVE